MQLLYLIVTPSLDLLSVIEAKDVQEYVCCQPARHVAGCTTQESENYEDMCKCKLPLGSQG